MLLCLSSLHFGVSQDIYKDCSCSSGFRSNVSRSWVGYVDAFLEYVVLGLYRKITIIESFHWCRTTSDPHHLVRKISVSSNFEILSNNTDLLITVSHNQFSKVNMDVVTISEFWTFPLHPLLQHKITLLSFKLFGQETFCELNFTVSALSALWCVFQF